MGEGFYKISDEGEVAFANAIYTPEYSLTKDNRGDFTFPVDGWTWYDETPDLHAEVSYQRWELRIDAVSECKKLVAESSISVEINGETLPLRSAIEEWYASQIDNVSDFLKSATDDFYNAIVEGDNYWWDLDDGGGTVRQQAIDLIEPLTVQA